MTQFGDIGISDKFSGYFSEMGFSVPSEVQRKAIPAFLEGGSPVVISQTGTGKTLSYCLPLVQILKQIESSKGLNPNKSEPIAFVMAPTRELVMQVGDVLKRLSHHMKFRVRVLIGGLGKDRSKSVKDSAFDVLVGTPRKILKAVEEGEISLKELKFAIFDEADNLFEMGYEEDVLSLEKRFTGKSVQLGFYTATMPSAVEKALEGVFDKYKPSFIKMPGAHTLIKTVEVTNIPMEERQRYSVLSAMIDRKPNGRGIVFITKKTECQQVFDKVTEDYPRLKKVMLHGDMEPEERRKSFKSMKEYKAQVLFATDIAARGMDLEDISWVINYDLPKTTDYYVHRCGRTARMGKEGFVFNFVSTKDKAIIQKINRSIEQNRELRIESHGLSKLKAKSSVKAKKLTEEEKDFIKKSRESASRRGKGRTINRVEGERLKREKNARLKQRREKAQTGRKGNGKKKR